MTTNNLPPLNPMLGGTDRETMGNVYDVLAFVSRATEIPLEVAHSNHGQAEFRGDEMHGLTLIYQTPMQALAYEVPPSMPFG